MDLYSENILEYYKHPPNKGQFAACNVQASEANPTCGDKIQILLHVEDGKIIKAQFDGEGCAISQAATSMILESLEGKSLEEAKNIDNQEVYDLLGIEISPGRVKCALLGLVATKKAIILHQNA